MYLVIYLYIFCHLYWWFNKVSRHFEVLENANKINRWCSVAFIALNLVTTLSSNAILKSIFFWGDAFCCFQHNICKNRTFWDHYAEYSRQSFHFLVFICSSNWQIFANVLPPVSTRVVKLWKIYFFTIHIVGKMCDNFVMIIKFTMDNDAINHNLSSLCWWN